jgi:hypothetical protein
VATNKLRAKLEELNVATGSFERAGVHEVKADRSGYVVDVDWRRLESLLSQIQPIIDVSSEKPPVRGVVRVDWGQKVREKEVLAYVPKGLKRTSPVTL